MKNPKTLADVFHYFNGNFIDTAGYMGMHRTTVSKHLRENNGEDVIIIDEEVYVRKGYTNGPIEEFGNGAKYDRTKYLPLAQEIYDQCGLLGETAHLLGHKTKDVESWRRQLNRWRDQGVLTKNEYKRPE